MAKKEKYTNSNLLLELDEEGILYGCACDENLGVHVVIGSNDIERVTRLIPKGNKNISILVDNDMVNKEYYDL